MTCRENNLPFVGEAGIGPVRRTGPGDVVVDNGKLVVFDGREGVGDESDTGSNQGGVERRILRVHRSLIIANDTHGYPPIMGGDERVPQAGAVEAVEGHVDAAAGVVE